MYWRRACTSGVFGAGSALPSGLPEGACPSIPPSHLQCGSSIASPTFYSEGSVRTANAAHRTQRGSLDPRCRSIEQRLRYWSAPTQSQPAPGPTAGCSGRRWPPSECKVPLHAVAVSMISGTPDFGAVTSFDGDEVTVSLRGTVQNEAAFELGAILDAAIDSQPTSMVLDLAELDFMGAAGLIAVSNAERRLASMGVTLL